MGPKWGISTFFRKGVSYKICGNSCTFLLVCFQASLLLRPTVFIRLWIQYKHLSISIQGDTFVFINSILYLVSTVLKATPCMIIDWSDLSTIVQTTIWLLSRVVHIRNSESIFRGKKGRKDLCLKETKRGFRAATLTHL